MEVELAIAQNPPQLPSWVSLPPSSGLWRGKTDAEAPILWPPDAKN